MTKRTFPFSSGDRIRMTNWPEDKYVTIFGYGDVLFLGKLNTGEEESYYKDAKMAYNSEWELYAPTPPAREVWVVFQDDGEVNRIWFESHSSHQYPQGWTIWKATLTPTERTYP